FEGDQLSATTPWFWRVGRRQKFIKAPQVLYLRGFFYVQNPSKATNSNLSHKLLFLFNRT
ncbi:hypothetical protein KKB55_20600, partial [Myxococcota bacterium]|nr:hypothetical protein [Myxococcota bacterium]